MLHQLFVPQAIRVLNSLEAMLDKAKAYSELKNFDPQVLINSRLAPDQFHMGRQIQIACDSAKFCASRMTGIDAPVFEDNEKTLDEFQARIQKTIEYLKTVKAADFDSGATRAISNKYWDGKTLTGTDYLISHAIPNLYFHVTTAYAIMRHNGVDLGKKDFLGDLPFQK